MEPLTTILLSEVEANGLTGGEINWKKCNFCQENKFPKKKFPLSKGTTTGIPRVLHCTDIRDSCNDEKYEHAIGRLKGLKDVENQDVFWHRDCYSEFTNEGHIQRLQKRGTGESEENGAEVSASRKFLLDRTDWSKCMFCQKDSKGLCQVQTMETSEKILRNASTDEEMSGRLAGVSDLIAAEGKYHLKCYARFQRNSSKVARSNQVQDSDCDPRGTCFEETMSLLENGMSRGNIFTHSKQYGHTSLADLSCITTLIPAFIGETSLRRRSNVFYTTKFQPMNPSESLLIVSTNLSESVLRSLLKAPNLEPGDIDFDTELLSWLYRVAVNIHNDIKSAHGHNCIGNINEKSAEEVVPESLFMLIAMLCAGDNDNEERTTVEIKMRVLSICQDIVFLASRGRKLTPKHVGLGLAVHQATRYKQLLHLLHSVGHSISYETVLRMDNTIANDVLQKYNENGNVFVPQNFHINSVASYTRYAVDNIDINQETLNGMGTFHATQYATLRRVEDGVPKIDVQITPKSDRKLNLKIPSELHELQEVDLGNEKPEPVMKGAVMDEWYTPDELCIDESFEKDLAWILVRLALQHPEIQQVPGWSGFNQMLSSDKSQTTMLGLLPIINAPAHEFETLWTVIQKCKAMTKLRKGSYTVVTMDEVL